MARRSKKRKSRDNVAIVGDGQTERYYFADVRDTDRPPLLDIFPHYPSRIGNYAGVLRRAIELAADYKRVYALIDMDKVIQDRTQSAYEIAKRQAHDQGVIVLENNPCFEIWLLLHFTKTSRLFTGCDDVVTKLKQFIPKYDKSERFLKSAGLYKNHKGLIQQPAIANARFLEVTKEDQDELYPRAEIFKFFDWYLNRPG